MTVSSGWYQLMNASRELVSWLWCQQGESSCSLSNLVSRNSLTQLNTAWMTRYRGDTGSACSARSSVCFTSFEGSNKQELRVLSWCGHPDLVINHYLLLSLVSTVPGWLASSSPQCWWSRSRSWGVLCHFLHSLVEERVPIGTSISLQRKQYRIEFWVMNSVKQWSRERTRIMSGIQSKSC